MITKIYEQPEIEIYKFSAEAGFSASKEIDGGETSGFGQTDLGGGDDWGD